MGNSKPQILRLSMTDAKPAKYEGPHAGFRSSCDDKVNDWTKSLVEDRNCTADNASVFDSKWKHSKGFVKYKLVSTNPASDDNSYAVQLAHEATLRVNNGDISMHSEIKGRTYNKHVDFGSKGMMDGKLWLNPFFSFDSDRSLGDRKWTLGGVWRMKGLLWRMQAQLSGAVKDVTTNVAHRGEYLHEHWAFRWAHGHKVGNSSPDYLKAALGYTNDTFGATAEVGHRSKGELAKEDAPWMHPAKAARARYVSLWGHYNCGNAWTFAARAEADPKDVKEGEFTGGVQYKLDKNTSMMGKLDLGLENTWYMSHKLNANSTIMFTTSMNLADFGSTSQDKEGYMGYPFVYGMKLKYEA